MDVANECEKEEAPRPGCRLAKVETDRDNSVLNPQIMMSKIGEPGAHNVSPSSLHGCEVQYKVPVCLVGYFCVPASLDPSLA